MARLGRSRPVNWLISRRRPSLAIPAAASLPAGASLTAGASVTGSAILPLVTQAGPSWIPPAAGEMDAGVSLQAGGSIAGAAVLPAETAVTALPDAWVFTGPAALTYLQYLDAAGTLAVTPGQAVVSMEAASGWPYALAVPPPDGRWVALGGGGELFTLTAGPGERGDPLAWDPPAPLAHLPVPFDVIRKRIQARHR